MLLFERSKARTKKTLRDELEAREVQGVALKIGRKDPLKREKEHSKKT